MSEWITARLFKAVDDGVHITPGAVERMIGQRPSVNGSEVPAVIREAHIDDAGWVVVTLEVDPDG